MSSATPSRSSRPPVGPLLALVTVGGLAVLLWGAGLFQLGTTGSALLTGPLTTGDVLSCTKGPIGPGCTVRYKDPKGVPDVRTIDHPGLIGVSPGESVALSIDKDGSLRVAGWRAWVDGLILIGLALAMTSGAIRWFASVLRAGDARTSFDLDDASDRRRRKAG